MRFKVGDYVRVKKDLKDNVKYGNVIFSKYMSKYCGNIYKVKWLNDFYYGTYTLEGCKRDARGNYMPYIFSDEMLEPATKYQVGDYVRVKNDLKVGEWYDGLLFNEKMKKYCGHIYKVIGIVDCGHYKLEGCEDEYYMSWCFNDEMLEDFSRIKLDCETITLSTEPETEHWFVKLLKEKQSLKARGNMDAIDAIKYATNSVYGTYGITDMLHNYCKADVNCTMKMIKETNPKQPEIDKVMPNEKKRAVAVKFKDGDVVTVKCSKDDKFDIYTGVAHAIAKKMFKSGSHFKKVVDSLTVADKSKKKENKKRPSAITKEELKKFYTDTDAEFEKYILEKYGLTPEDLAKATNDMFKEKIDDKSAKETKKTSKTKKTALD